MNNKYIAVFDSGIGGLTVVKALKEILPQENIIYFGDTLNMPYGEKNVDEIKQFAINNINFFNTFDVKAYVVACGTMTANAMDDMIHITDKPVIGVIEPSCLQAISLSINKRIGVLATPASINSNVYENTIKGIDANIIVTSVGCEGLAKQIELGRFTNDNLDTIELLKKYLKPLQDSNVDTIILGCTHYPLVSKLIEELMPNVKIVSCSLEEALFVKKYLMENNLLSLKHLEDKYYVSNNPKDFIKTAKLFMPEFIDEVNVK